jgi:hypothetical protein
MRLFLGLALIAAAPALAQTPPPVAPAAPPTARQRLMAADANKDGKWNKQEWLAAGRREMGFSMADTNSDGFVNQAELAEGIKRMRAMGMSVPE